MGNCLLDGILLCFAGKHPTEPWGQWRNAGIEEPQPEEIVHLWNCGNSACLRQTNAVFRWFGISHPLVGGSAPILGSGTPPKKRGPHHDGTLCLHKASPVHWDSPDYRRILSYG